MAYDGFELHCAHGYLLNQFLSAKSMLLDPNWVAHVETGEDLKAFTSGDAGVAYTEKPLP